MSSVSIQPLTSAPSNSVPNAEMAAQSHVMLPRSSLPVGVGNCGLFIKRSTCLLVLPSIAQTVSKSIDQSPELRGEWPAQWRRRTETQWRRRTETQWSQLAGSNNGVGEPNGGRYHTAR